MTDALREPGKRGVWARHRRALSWSAGALVVLGAGILPLVLHLRNAPKALLLRLDLETSKSLWATQGDPWHQAGMSRLSQLFRLNPAALAVQENRVGVERSVTIDLAGRGKAAVVVHTVSSSRPGVTLWEGVVTGSQRSSVTLVRSESSVAGDIWLGDTLYEIQPWAQDIYSIEILEQGTAPREAPPRRQPPTKSKKRADLPSSSCAAETVAVLVLYTNETQYVLGDAGIQVRAALAEHETNVAFANSGIRHRIRVVGIKHVHFTSTENMEGDLDRLASGQLDSVLLWRDSTNADVVSLWTGPSMYQGFEAAGLGNLIADPPEGAARAFFVVQWKWATGYYSFGHELGHILGADHDHADADNSTPPARPFAYGYQDPSSGFRDIMSYDCTPSCPRVQYFSTPNVLLSGRPVGTSYTANPSLAADAADTFDETACSVAQYHRVKL